MSIITQSIIYPQSIVREERQVHLGESELIERFPVRTEITVLPADSASSLAWRAYETIGVTVINPNINLHNISITEGFYIPRVNPLFFLFDYNDKETVKKLVLEEVEDPLPIMGFSL